MSVKSRSGTRSSDLLEIATATGRARSSEIGVGVDAITVGKIGDSIASPLPVTTLEPEPSCEVNVTPASSVAVGGGGALGGDGGSSGTATVLGAWGTVRGTVEKTFCAKKE